MIKMNIIGIALIIHTIVCIGACVSAQFHWFRMEKIYLPIVILIPFWGGLSVLLLNIGGANPEKVDTADNIIGEEIFENIFSEENQDGETVVPLEEALIMNTSQQKRQLIMDVLYDSPGEYVDLLYEARLDDDKEVVHYATTAMAEMSKEYDVLLHKMKLEYELEPENETLLEEYCNTLGKYISMGLVRGRALSLHRKRYAQLLARKAENGLSIQEIRAKADNEMELGDYSKAIGTLRIMEKLCPEDEETWVMKLKYYTLMHDGEKVQALIAEMNEREIAITDKSRKVIDFWRNRR